jgi:hypothetical protein
MKKSINDDRKMRRGRPATGTAPLVGVRMTDELQDQIKTWAQRQEDDPPLATAIRRLVEIGLTVKARLKQGSRARADRANAMAGDQLDQLADKSATADQQATRKRRLLKGPEEFQSVRVDRTAKK